MQAYKPYAMLCSRYGVSAEYLVFRRSRKPFSTISGSWPKTIARRTQKHGARIIFGSGPNIWFLDRPEIVLTRFCCLAPNYCQNSSKHGSRAIFRSGPNIWFFVSKETYEIMFTEKGQHRTLQWTIGSKMRKVSYNSIFIGNLYRVLPYKTTFANIW